MCNLEVRCAQPGDAAKLIELIAQLKQESDQYTIDPNIGKLSVDDQAQQIMLVNQTRSFIIGLAFLDNQPVGMIQVQELQDSGIGELGIAVLNQYSHQGIGGQLMDFVIDWATYDSNLSTLALVVKKTNEHAIHLYERSGFTVVKKRVINALGSVLSTQEMQYNIKK